MADRDRYDWDRGRDFDREREYGRGTDRDRGDRDRGMMERGTDEVRSWFGDDEARRRRDIDEQRDRQFGERDYGPNSERARREHGWQGQASDPAWQSGRSGTYGDQRDFISRDEDWSGSRAHSPRGREWYDPGYDRGSRWQGGARDFGDEDSRRTANSQYSGSNYTSGQTSRSFSGGYGAANYGSGNFHAETSNPYGTYGGYGSRSGFGPRNSGWENYGSSGTSSYGRDFGTTGEGRWNEGNSAYYSSGGGFSGGSFSSGRYAGRGPRNYQRSDDRIREDVNERLTADARIDASDIDVHVQNGEVTLTGTVDERRTRRLAEEIIEDLPGVRDVRNDLRVNKGGWFGSHEQEQHGQDAHRQVGEQSRAREDGSIGHTGNPQQRDDVTTINTKDTGKR